MIIGINNKKIIYNNKLFIKKYFKYTMIEFNPFYQTLKLECR